MPQNFTGRRVDSEHTSTGVRLLAVDIRQRHPVKVVISATGVAEGGDGLRLLEAVAGLAEDRIALRPE